MLALHLLPGSHHDTGSQAELMMKAAAMLWLARVSSVCVQPLWVNSDGKDSDKLVPSGDLLWMVLITLPLLEDSCKSACN